MLRHVTSFFYPPGYDDDLAKRDALENWLRQVDQRGYEPAKNPIVHIVRDNRLIRPHTNSGTRTAGFRVSVRGDIQPKAAPPSSA